MSIAAAVRRGHRREPAMREVQLRIIRKRLFFRHQHDGTADEMHVCLCNGLTDRDLLPHTMVAANTVSMVYRACGCRAQCGKCVPFVRQMLREGREAATFAQIDGAE